MKHSIKPYSKDISEVQRAFYKSTQGLSHTSMVHKIKVKTKHKKTLQDLHISRERNKDENIPILVEERWDAFWGIPKLRCLSLLQYLIELLPLLLLLISRPPRSLITSST